MDRAGADHEQGVEPEVFHGDAHRAGEARLFGILELIPHSPPLVEEEEIEPAPPCVPQKKAWWARQPEDLLEGESLPRTADFGVRVELGGRAQAEEMMEEAGVAEIDLRGLDLAALPMFSNHGWSCRTMKVWSSSSR